LLVLVVSGGKAGEVFCRAACSVAAQQNPAYRYGTQQMADSSRQSPNAYDMNNGLIYVSMTFQMCWVGETYVADCAHGCVGMLHKPCANSVPHGGYHNTLHDRCMPTKFNLRDKLVHVCTQLSVSIIKLSSGMVQQPCTVKPCRAVTA
jgi:hypothetical protein